MTTYTINGQALLYTGCMPDTDCSTLGSQQIDQSADLPPGSVVIEQKCCSRDGCNGLQGLNNRTACMSCSEYEKYPTQCQHAVLCNPQQECMFYQFLDTNTYQKRIHLSCVNQEVCEILRSQSTLVFGKRDELAMKKHCCKTDYCNVFWDQTSSFPTNAHTTRQTTPSTTTAATTTTKTPSSTTQKTTTSSQTFVTLPTTATTTRIHFIPITNPKTTQKPAPSKTLVTLTNPPGSTYVQHTPTLPNTQTTTQVPQVTTFMGTTSTQHIPTLNHAANTPPSRVSTQRTPTAITTQPTTATTTSTTTTTLPTTSTEPPANRCYSSNKDSNIQTVIGCPDEAPYCLNNLTNYASGKIEVSKGCATASQCYWIPRDDSSVYCDIYSSAHTYFADFMCSSCCTGELCNQDTVASPNTPFNPTVIPPNPITHSPLKSTECYTCDDCHDAGTLSTCSGNTPYCLNHYSSSQWGVTHITKRCGAKQECHSQYYEGTRNNLLCSVFDENIHDNMRLECVFCCTASNCNEHARPPQSTLYKE
ncbi:mucin-2-like isoform X2 [Ostrea edulis]|nr:mucin-2-like isoform X2 [Ostrea edulis]